MPTKTVLSLVGIFVVLGAVGVVALVLPGSRPGSLRIGGDAPQAIVVGGPQYDFGLLEVGQTGSHEFVIRNEGPGILKLEAGKPSCKCTSFTIAETELQPGEQTMAEVEWSGDSSMVAFRQTAPVKTNDPKNPSIELVITGEILQLVGVEPSPLTLSRISSSKEHQSEFLVYSPAVEQFEITSIEPQNPETAKQFEISWTPAAQDDYQPLGGKSGYLCTLTVKPGLPLGQFNQKFTIKTTVPLKRNSLTPELKETELKETELKETELKETEPKETEPKETELKDTQQEASQEGGSAEKSGDADDPGNSAKDAAEQPRPETPRSTEPGPEEAGPKKVDQGVHREKGDQVASVEWVVRGVVEGDLSVLGNGYDSTRGRLTIGQVPRFQGAKRQLRLLARGPHRDITIKGVTTNKPGILLAKVGPKRTLTSKLVTFPIDIEIAADAPEMNQMGTKAGEIGVVTLQTDHPVTPQVRILVRYAVLEQ